MGASVVIMPNICDYWLQIKNPSQTVRQVLQEYGSQIFQQIYGTQKGFWSNLRISSFLLGKLIKQHKKVGELFEQSKEWILVARRTQQQTMDPQLYSLFSSKCRGIPSKGTVEVVEECFRRGRAFNFTQPGTILNVTQIDSLEIKQCQEIPHKYLLLDFNNTYDISIVQKGQSKLLFQSPLSQKLILKLIKKVQQRVHPEDLVDTIRTTVNQIFEEGDSQKVDLLVQDIFGKDKCGIIGLPPKLIASSLAKFAKEEVVSSTAHDQLKGLLIAFALNIGILAKEQVLLQKVKKVVFKGSQITHKQFLSVINTILAPHAEVFFIKSKSVAETTIQMVNQSIK